MLSKGKQWWDENLSEQERAQYLFALIKTLDTTQMGIQQQNLRSMRLYNYTDRDWETP